MKKLPWILALLLVMTAGLAVGLPPDGGMDSCSISCALSSCSASGGNCDCHCGGFLHLFAYCSCDGMGIDNPPGG